MQSPSILEVPDRSRLSSSVLLRNAPGRTLPPLPMRARRILVVRHLDGWPAAATRMLRTEGYELTFCNAVPDAPGCALVAQPDLVLLPASSVELSRTIRSLDPTGTRAIIAYGDDASGIECSVADALERGADDYVGDAGRTDEMRARIRTQLRHVRDREMLHWARDQRSSLRDLARTDPLTGLANRRAFDGALQDAVESPHPVTLVLIDLDHFKQINDAHGHPVGDLVLRRVARTLGLAAPRGAVVGRWGGEEFAIAVGGELEGAPEELGEQLRCAVKSIAFPEIEGGLRVTASVGIAHDGVDRRCWLSMDLIEGADQALYESKRSGRDRVTFAMAIRSEEERNHG
jgi:diguanylate cyclase (GGDEF)-like protein